jgi:uncharacterized protein YbbC (DUF1343 family)
MSSVRLGIDALLGDPAAALGPAAAGARIGLLTNDGARVGLAAKQTGALSRLAIKGHAFNLVRLFSPEHGLSASAPDGAAVPDGDDPETGLPVVSLYGKELRPSSTAVEDLDLIVVDIQDVGVRFYTYVWTLSHLMEVAAETSLPLVILDRPNPLGGREAWVEGPMPELPSPSSLLGRWPLPVRHSLTIGEIASLLREEMDLDLDLSVVSMKGWERGMLWRDTDLRFHPPSPAIPSPESALLYPGLALFEATNVLEGRGTPWPFRWFGAEWLDSRAMADAVNSALPDATWARPHPLSVARTGSDPCPGVLLEIRRPAALRPVALGLRLLGLFPTLYPERFEWAPYPTTVNPTGEGHLEGLLADPVLVQALEDAPETVDEDLIADRTSAREWWNRARPHLLYH